MTKSHDTPSPKPGHAESLFAKWAAQEEAGQAPPFEELLLAHPQHASELEELHADWILFAPLLGRVVPGLVSGHSTPNLTALSSHGASPSQTPPPDLPQDLLDKLQFEVPKSGRYKFRAVVGRGGGGVVLKVWDTKLHRSLAMKVVLGRTEHHPTGDTPKVDGRTLTRFVDEARIASQLNHPGIVPVHELGTDEAGRAFFTMKLVQGEDLSRVFAHVRNGIEDWNETRALGVLLKACEAMSFAHDKNVVHRDLKPANVMVGRHGEVYVMDWGLARVLGEEDHRDLRLRNTPKASSSMVDSLRRGEREDTPDSPLVTIDGAVLGTPAYMSPEQARGELELVGPQTDVYALGAMLYELLAGDPPFLPRGARVAPQMIVMRVIEGPPKPLADLAPHASPVLVAICERAMERDPNHRYPNVSVLADDLRAYLERRVVNAYESGTWAETRMWMLRNRALATSVAAGILALIAGLSLAMHQRDRAERSATREAQARIEADKSTALAEKRASETAEQARLADLAKDKASAAELAALKSAEEAKSARIEAETSRDLAVASAEDASRARNETERKAEEMRLLAIRAQQDRVAALLNAEEARAAKAQADARAQEAKEQLYAASVLAAQVAHRNGEPGYARRLLEKAPVELRNWEWNYLNAATDTSILTLNGHDSGVTTAMFSPNGRVMFTATMQGSMYLWEAGSGQKLWEVIAKSSSRSRRSTFKFSPDSERILEIPPQGYGAQLWETKTGRLAASLEGHWNSITNGVFSSDGSRIITSSGDETARVWSVDTGEELVRLGEAEGGITSAIFSPDDACILTGGRRAAIWDSKTGALLRQLQPADIPVSNLFYCAEGSRITGVSMPTASQSSSEGLSGKSSTVGGEICVWNAESGERMTQIPVPGRPLPGSSLGIATNRLYLASADGKVRILDSTTLKELASIEAGQALESLVELSEDGSLVAGSTGRTVTVWDAQHGEVHSNLAAHSGTVAALGTNADGSRLIAGSEDGTARIFDTSVAALRFTHSGSLYGYSDIFFSRNGYQAITLPLGSAPPEVWDLTSGQKHPVLVPQEGLISTIPQASMLMREAAWERQRQLTLGQILKLGPSSSRIRLSPNESLLVGRSKHSIHVWQMMSGRELWRAALEDTPYVTTRFSPDSRRILLAVRNSEIRILNSGMGEELVTLADAPFNFMDAAFSPDSRSVLVCADTAIRFLRGAPDDIESYPRHLEASGVWDAETGKQRYELPNGIQSCYSPDGSRIAIWNAQLGLQILDAKSGRRVRQVDGAFPESGLLEYSPDGTQLLTATIRGPARVTSIEGTQGGTDLSGGASTPESACYSRDGSRIAVAWASGQIGVFDSTSGVELLRLDGTQQSTLGIQFSPDGTRLIRRGVAGFEVWNSTPQSAHYAKHLAMESVRAEAISLADMHFRKSPEWSTAAEWIRADRTISALARGVALSELARRTNSLALRASQAEQLARDRNLVQEKVIASLEGDKTLSDTIRSEALRLARIREEGPAELQDRIWNLVEFPGFETSTYSQAAQSARQLLMQDPTNTQIAGALGIALYRAGEWAAALDRLAPLAHLSSYHGRMYSAVLAMAHFRLGNQSEAISWFDKLGLALAEIPGRSRERFPVEEAMAFIREHTNSDSTDLPD